MTPLNDQQRQEIDKELFAGRKISAIRIYRDATGAGLAEAKKAVEDMETDLRRQSPERFVSAEKKGCFAVVVCLALFTFAVAAVLIFAFRTT